jgi:hypothetical protein
LNILTFNLLLSTLIFWVAARLYLLPHLNEIQPKAVLLPVLLLHSFRHLGLMFVTPGATYAGIPLQFAYPAAYGDMLAAALALLSIPAVALGHWSSRPLLWVFNVEGSLDLFTAIRWRLCMRPRLLWGLRIGFRHFGCRPSWSLTISSLSCY